MELVPIVRNQEYTLLKEMELINKVVLALNPLPVKMVREVILRQERHQRVRISLKQLFRRSINANKMIVVKYF